MDPGTVLFPVTGAGLFNKAIDFPTFLYDPLHQCSSCGKDIQMFSARSMKTGFAKAEEVLEASKQRNEIREKILELSSRYYDSRHYLQF